MKVCSRCNQEKNINLFSKDKQKSDGLCSYCKECNKKDYHKSNTPEKRKTKMEYWHANKVTKGFLEKNRTYQKENKEKLRQYHLDKYYKYKSNDLYRMKIALRARIKNHLKVLGIRKWTKTNDILGCDYDTCKKHIESLFLEGMSWDNHSMHGWHVDHKIPLSLAKDQSQLIELCNYKNLQPLWAGDNLSKGNKLLS